MSRSGEIWQNSGEGWTVSTAGVASLQRELDVPGVHTEPTSDPGEHLRQTMENADAAVFMVTPASVANAYAMTEVGAAIPVVPANGRAGKRDATSVAETIRDRSESPL